MSEFEVVSVSHLFVNVYNSIKLNAAFKPVHVCTFFQTLFIKYFIWTNCFVF